MESKTQLSFPNGVGLSVIDRKGATVDVLEENGRYEYVLESSCQPRLCTAFSETG
jgi:hypothetical protein